MAGNRRHFRWIVFLPAALLASVSPASADTTFEGFDDTSYDLSVQLAAGAFWCDSYSNQYGTTGPSLCMFNTQEPTVFEFPVPVQGFQFVAGAKNGSSEITVFYSDGTTGAATVDGSCCETTVVVETNEDNPITGFSVPSDPDLWLLDSLVWVSSSLPTTTSTELSQTSSTVEQETSTSTATTSSTVAATTPTAPPPSTPMPEETVASTSPETTVVPSTTASPTTTFLVTTTSSAPPTSTVAPSTVPSTMPPDASGSPESDANPDPAPDIGVVEQPPSDAPIEQKLEFESKVDVFSGDYDEYVPVGSTITVAQRRTVVAVTAVLIMFAPPPSRMRQK